jgi:hypothetical protein
MLEKILRTHRKNFRIFVRKIGQERVQIAKKNKKQQIQRGEYSKRTFRHAKWAQKGCGSSKTNWTGSGTGRFNRTGPAH